MKLGKTGKILTSIFAAAVLGGAGFGVYEAATTFSPASAGVTYLDNHDFTHVTTTGDSHATYACGRGGLSQSYKATDKSGKREKVQLCFGSFHRISQP